MYEMKSFDRHLEQIKKTTESKSFQNAINQIRAKALLMELSQDISLTEWKYDALGLVRNLTSSTMIMQTLALNDSTRLMDYELTLRQLALAWESLATLEESTDAILAKINASTLYELAGYQANAVCLAKKIEMEFRDDFTPLELLAVSFLRRYFVKTIGLARKIMSDSLSDIQTVIAQRNFVKGILDISLYFLNGNEKYLDSGLENLQASENVYDMFGDIFRSNLIHSIRSLIPTMKFRSTWEIIGPILPSDRWIRYMKLLSRGLGSSILESWSVSELWPSQIKVINQGTLSSSSSKVVKMPTSAGKTRAAEMAIAHTLISNPMSKCIYVAPYRALVWELKQSFVRLFGDLGFNVSTIMGTYETDEFEKQVVQDADLLIVTPEKLDLILRTMPDFLEHVRLFVLDEVQIVIDETRGVKFELLMTRIRRKLPNARFLLLSAVISKDSLEHLANWLNANPDTDILELVWRPSIQRVASFSWSQNKGMLRYRRMDEGPVQLGFVSDLISSKRYTFRNPNTGRKNTAIFPKTDNKAQTAAELALKYAEIGPVLVFCAQTNYAESVAKAIARRLEISGLTENQLTLRTNTGQTQSLISATEWLGQNHLVTKMLKLGVALHHGKLPESVRVAVANDFRNRHYKIIIATNTLAQGVNLPIRTVIVHTCRRYQKGSFERIPARDYWNVAGRAGRPGQETTGTIVHIIKSRQDTADYNYFAQHREEVETQNSALFELLMGLIEQRITDSDIRELLDSEILAILVEETGSFIKDTFAKDLLDCTLAKTQAEKAEKSLGELQRIVGNIAEGILNKIPDESYLGVYSSTGLCTASCEGIRMSLSGQKEMFKDLLKNMDPKSIDRFVEIIISILLEVKEMELEGTHQYLGSLLKKWISGQKVDIIWSEFRSDFNSIEKLAKFIEVVFCYRFPWGISGILKIASKELDVEESEFSPFIKYFPSMVKNGVPNPEASWAVGAGVPFRDAAILIGKQFIDSDREKSYTEFQEWLSDLDSEYLQHEFKISGSYLEDLVRELSAASKNPLLEKNSSIRELLPMQERIVGIKYENRRVELAKSLKIGDNVSITRNYDNRIDRNAIGVYHKGAFLGYLRRQVAQLAAVDMDTGVQLSGRVIGTTGGKIPRITIEIREDGYLSVVE